MKPKKSNTNTEPGAPGSFWAVPTMAEIETRQMKRTAEKRSAAATAVTALRKRLAKAQARAIEPSLLELQQQLKRAKDRKF